ncbi:ATP-dependent endonuclease [Curtobacterium sp. B8]|uniref:ATP-dependent nuclease n=1 Tax=Curtobacterium sp. B8 TaxID=95611 RepID=UPI00034689F2|nr:ATP-binding protein [Curtobacterium sp. B8]
MRLREVRLEGFRGYKTGVAIPVGESLTALAGRNDAGKSTVLEALEIFFGASKLASSDISVGFNGDVAITCSFDDLPNEVVVDSARSTSLAEEYLLNGDGYLELTKRWVSGRTGTPVLSARANHPVFDSGDDPLNSKIAELRALASKFAVDLNAVDARVKSEIRQAIWNHALVTGSARLEVSDVPLASEDGKDVGIALSRYFPIFHLFRSDRAGVESDQLAQDPARAIVKSVLDRHADELASVNATIQSEISAMLEAVVEKLGEVAPGLARELQPVEPEPSWSKAYSGMQFVDDSGVPLARRGSGTRRLVLLSFFRAEVEKVLSDDEGMNRSVIIAVEEPETALHADMQQEILAALSEVAELPGRQVIITTHSANLLRNVSASDIRYIRGTQLTRECVTAEADGGALLFEELNESLGLFTDHNVRCFVLVEGRNDISALKNLSSALAQSGAMGIRSFGELEREGRLAFMPIGGSGSASLWASTLSPFRRPEVHLFDSDRIEAGGPLKAAVQAAVDQATEQQTVVVLQRRELENYLDRQVLVDTYAEISDFAERFDALLPNAGAHFADFPTTCARIVYESATGGDWDQLEERSRAKKETKVKKRLAEAFGAPAYAKRFADAETDLLDCLRTISWMAESNEAVGAGAR